MATFDVGRIIILESTLSFLGLGWNADPRAGVLISGTPPSMSAGVVDGDVPGIAIMLVVLGVNLLGDALAMSSIRERSKLKEYSMMRRFAAALALVQRWPLRRRRSADRRSRSRRPRTR
jgi:hypothetical protein